MEIKYISPRDYIGDILNKISEEDSRIVVIDSDLSSSVTTNKFYEKYPERFFEMGIAEQNSLGVSCGLSIEGFIPFYVNFSIFITGTVWTQLRQACYSKFNIKLIGTHPGMDNGPDGASHHSLEDLALTRALANLTILNPIDVNELEEAIKLAIKIEGPVYIRCARDIVPCIENKNKYEVGKIRKIVDEGKDYCIIFEGTSAKQVFEAYDHLKVKGYRGKLISIACLKPLDIEGILSELKDIPKIVTVENHTINGGLGSAISEIIAENNIDIKFVRIGVRDTFTESGKTAEVKEKYGLCYKNIVKEIID